MMLDYLEIGFTFAKVILENSLASFNSRVIGLKVRICNLSGSITMFDTKVKTRTLEQTS
jgi:hypothetical protein